MRSEIFITMKFRGTMEVNEEGHLSIGGCDTVGLAKEFGTPLFVMDEDMLRSTCREFHKGFMEREQPAQVIYASKSFMTTAMCRIVDEEDLGLDVVSGGELYTALKAEFPSEKIYFHGNNKTLQELSMALENGVGNIVVDNLLELDRLEAMAATLKTKPNILLRITPGVEAHTHKYIQTGQIDSKFGFTLPNGDAMEAVKAALDKKHLHLSGLHCHIGSQIFEMESYRYAVEVMIKFMHDIKEETGKELSDLNLGGGFGIYYAKGDEPASISEYADVVLNAVAETANNYGVKIPKVLVEPGRSIAGPAGSTLYTVGSIKEIPEVRKYLAVDGGMTDNIRPALYDAEYEVMLANRANEKPVDIVSITGKCCESGDMLAWDVLLPEANAGDILAMGATGAYCYTMSSNYNRLGRPAVVLVKDGQADLIVRRETYDDMLRNEVLPERLKRDNVVSLVSMG